MADPVTLSPPSTPPGSAPKRPVLTDRERQVLQAIADGASNPQIARQLALGLDTVKTHVTRLMRKLGVQTRTTAVTRGLQLGVVSIDGVVRSAGAPRGQVMLRVDEKHAALLVAALFPQGKPLDPEGAQRRALTALRRLGGVEEVAS